jgi:adenine phosphoribosyltransferase
MSRSFPDAAAIIAAIRLVGADFAGRPTYRVVGKGGRKFEFFPTSITDNIPPLHPDVSRAICLLSGLHLEHQHAATLGIGEEDRGAMIISDVLSSYNLPRTLARWTPTGAPGEVQVVFSNEYIQEGDARIFLNGVRAHDRVVIVDDLVSTGGTLVALIEAVRLTRATILEVLTIGEKSENGGRDYIRKKTGYEIKTMLTTSLEYREDGCRSRLDRFHLGQMPKVLFDEVASAFPPDFCKLGSGA